MTIDFDTRASLKRIIFLALKRFTPIYISINLEKGMGNTGILRQCGKIFQIFFC
jgi:hypothetical protein